MEDMIEDLHWPTRLQGFDIKHEKAWPSLDFLMLIQAARTPIYDGATFLVLWAAIENMNLQTSYG
jgi:hypothetical protein